MEVAGYRLGKRPGANIRGKWERKWRMALWNFWWNFILNSIWNLKSPMGKILWNLAGGLFYLPGKHGKFRGEFRGKFRSKFRRIFRNFVSNFRLFSETSFSRRAVLTCSLFEERDSEGMPWGFGVGGWEVNLVNALWGVQAHLYGWSVMPEMFLLSLFLPPLKGREKITQTF